MNGLAATLLGLWIGIVLYAYAGYPMLLHLLLLGRRGYAIREEDPEDWPRVSVSLPVYNEEDVIEQTLEGLLALDYPEDRLEIVVVSDASTDGTDAIVRSYAERGVKLVRLESRGGKTAAENAAIPHLRGDIVVNTDASTRALPGSLRPLVRSFQDPAVGVASGRDRSVARTDDGSLEGESRYVSYEMAIRDLETRLGGLVGASGCFYAIRRELHDRDVAAWLDRDFMAALQARERGFRAVSVSEAVVLVPRSRSLADEFRRKVRTMSRGLRTLWTERHLMNPLRWGRFAWMVLSHKAARWLVPLLLPGAVAGTGWLALQGSLLGEIVMAAGGGAGVVGLLAVFLAGRKDLPSAVALCGYAVTGAAAGIAAWGIFLFGGRETTWTPTRRPGEEETSADAQAPPAGGG